jgi:hypothetical protein
VGFDEEAGRCLLEAGERGQSAAGDVDLRDVDFRDEIFLLYIPVVAWPP